MNKKANVIGYVRESTEKQCEETEGLEIQADRIRSFCAKNNYNLIDIITDEGISGARDINERPGILKLLEYSKDSSIQYIIIDKIDRFSRDLCYQLWVEKEIMKNDSSVLYATNENLNIGNTDSDMDRIMKEAMREMMGVFAKIERKMIVKRLSDGMKKKASNGNKPVGRQPFGYEYDHTDNNKSTIINMAQAKVVKEIFTMRQNGTTLDKIASILNSPEHRRENVNAYTGNNTDRVWTNQSVRFVLMNDYYIGKVTHGGEKTDGNHPAIVDMSLWKAVAG